MTIRKFLSSLDANKNTPLFLNFSSRTTSMDVQTVIETSVEQRGSTPVFR